MRKLGKLKAWVAVAAALAVVAGIGGGITKAATTVAPTYPGNVVRDNTITITTMPVAVMFSRTTGNYSVTAPFTAGGALGCRGDNPAGVNNSPRTSVTIVGPGGAVLDTLSPVINTGISGALANPPYPPLAVQPAPNDTNYRGGAPPAAGTAGSTAFAAGNTRPFVNTVNLAGKPAGIYTITTVTRNVFRNVTGCTVGTAIPGTTTATPGPITNVQTFEYRPWQHVFTDVFGGGVVNMNISPKEFQARVGTQTGSIYPGDPYMTMYALPGLTPGADPLPFMLPSDPTTCAANPNSCLPSTAVECPQATASCVPSVVVINKDVPGDKVLGVFDLQSKAFIAAVNVNGYQRTLLSLGTANDAAYHDLLNQLAAQAAAQGVNLTSILATKVRVRDGAYETSLSLLNGLQIQPHTGQAGIQIVSDFTVQAGLILNIYASLGGPVCVANVGDSNPATAAPDRYTALTDAGYTVQKSDLLPEVPRVGPAGALVGGPIYHIKGDFVGTAAALVNTSTAVIGVDTAADEPNGYPIWIEPFVSTPAHVTVARTMDFLGTATWSASETPVTGIGCLTVDFMLGAGVALYNNPLDLGFGDIPIWDPQSPEVAALIAQINAAVQSGVDQVANDPTVAGLLQQILDAAGL